MIYLVTNLEIQNTIRILIHLINKLKLMQVAGCAHLDYMSNQFDINEKMRAILIDWLIEVKKTY